jgi:hypothetical protein
VSLSTFRAAVTTAEAADPVAVYRPVGVIVPSEADQVTSKSPTFHTLAVN